MGRRLKFLEIPGKLYNGARFHIRQKYFSKEIRDSKKDKIVFLVQNGCYITGGVLSIITMYKIARELFPDKDVYIAVWANKQKADTFKEIDFDGRVINLKHFLKHWIHNGCNIILNVYETGLLSWWRSVKKTGLEGELKDVTLNILNQNQDLMPADKEVEPMVPYFKKVTMTLAYKANEKTNEKTYLDFPALHVGAFFDGEEPAQIPYKEKDDLVILSCDENPVKEIVKGILSQKGYQVFDSYPIPYNKFVALQKKAKFTISLGEGWDGYTMGQFNNGGIGIGVYQPNFTQTYFRSDQLPQFLFSSYEEMTSRLSDILDYYENEEIFDSENKKWVDIMNENETFNSREKVRKGWIEYYKKIGWNVS